MKIPSDPPLLSNLDKSQYGPLMWLHSGSEKRAQTLLTRYMSRHPGADIKIYNTRELDISEIVDLIIERIPLKEGEEDIYKP